MIRMPVLKLHPFQKNTQKLGSSYLPQASNIIFPAKLESRHSIDLYFLIDDTENINNPERKLLKKIPICNCQRLAKIHLKYLSKIILPETTRKKAACKLPKELINYIIGNRFPKIKNN